MAELSSAVLKQRVDALQLSTLPYTIEDVDVIVHKWLREWFDAEIVEDYLNEIQTNTQL